MSAGFRRTRLWGCLQAPGQLRQATNSPACWPWCCSPKRPAGGR